MRTSAADPRPRPASSQSAPWPDTADPVDRLEINAARHGFEPRRVERRSSVELVLGRCPFEATAAAPEIVCELHCGSAEGIAEASGGAVEVTDLVAHTRRAGCRLKLTRPSGSVA